MLVGGPAMFLSRGPITGGRSLLPSLSVMPLAMLRDLAGGGGRLR
ncbi:hypothetical protein TLA_TLA_00570 [Tessaracoccus lapidicaptus]|nr:hypothetical protein TLA_TLA_00570 [Tessaracoccus lapidicaptus]